MRPCESSYDHLGVQVVVGELVRHAMPQQAGGSKCHSTAVRQAVIGAVRQCLQGASASWNAEEFQLGQVIIGDVSYPTVRFKLQPPHTPWVHAGLSLPHDTKQPDLQKTRRSAWTADQLCFKQKKNAGDVWYLRCCCVATSGGYSVVQSRATVATLFGEVSQHDAALGAPVFFVVPSHRAVLEVDDLLQATVPIPAVQLLDSSLCRSDDKRWLSQMLPNVGVSKAELRRILTEAQVHELEKCYLQGFEQGTLARDLLLKVRCRSPVRPQPQTLNATLSTPNPQPCTLNPRGLSRSTSCFLPAFTRSTPLPHLFFSSGPMSAAPSDTRAIPQGARGARYNPFDDGREPQSNRERAQLEGFVSALGFVVLGMSLCARFASLALMLNVEDEPRFPSLLGIDWANETEDHAHHVLDRVMSRLNQGVAERNHLGHIFNHVVQASDPKLHKDVLFEVNRCFNNNNHNAMAAIDSGALNRTALRMEMYSQWQSQKADSRFDKIGLPEDGERRQIVVDDFNDEPAGSQLREAKDLVHTLASSQTAQSTLANVARSASGLHSRQGTTAQSFHADGEYNLNSPADIGVHPLWRNLYLVSVQPVQSPTALNVVPGSAQLMALLPEDCSDTGRCWNMDELCKRAGLPGFGCALPHLSLSLFPGSYVMFLDHFIHGGGACCDQFGSWRVHMYSDGIGTHDRVAHLETCLLGPKCCSIAGIPGPQWGHSTDVDAQSITCGLLQRSKAALHLRSQCHQLTPTPWAKI